MFSSIDLKKEAAGVHGVMTGRPGAWLRVSGPDAAEFLQGQCTQELRGLKAGQAVPALWLNPKGKILGESLVLRAEGDAWWLWSAFTAGEVLRARLEDFIIADDVVVEDCGAWGQVTLAGAEAEAWLVAERGGAALPGAGAWVEFGGGVLFAGRRGLERVWDWLRPADGGDGERVAAELGELSVEGLKRARIAAGVPAIPGEFGPADLPQEAGLEAVAVSFTKGCYLGQEVMARLHAMGQVRRRLVRVAGEGALPATGAELRQNGRRAGEIRAVAADGRGGWIGLGLVNLLGLDAGAGLRTADDLAVSILDGETEAQG